MASCWHCCPLHPRYSGSGHQLSTCVVRYCPSPGSTTGPITLLQHLSSSFSSSPPCPSPPPHRQPAAPINPSQLERVPLTGAQKVCLAAAGPEACRWWGRPTAANAIRASPQLLTPWPSSSWAGPPPLLAPLQEAESRRVCHHAYRDELILACNGGLQLAWHGGLGTS